MDLAAPRSTPVYAPGAGQVVVTGEGSGYGLYVILEHKPTPYRSLLGHLSRIDVDDGQPVEAGAQIGAVGSTGLSTGPHLHFEVQVGSSPVLLPELYDSLLQQRDSIASASASPLPQ